MTGEPQAGTDARGIDVQPDDEYFDVMAEVADTHWWYVARRTWLVQELSGRIAQGGVAIDVGTGTAQTLRLLESLGARTALGTDLSEHVLRHAVRAAAADPSGRRGSTRVVKSLAEQLPVADATAGCLISMDVIEHLDDDVAALREYRRALRPGATLFVTVPAYQWLWSEHDDRAAHRRRYTRRQLEQAVRAAGFEVERSSYYFSFLVPPAILMRRTPLRRLFSVTDEEASAMHPALDALFAWLARTERRIGRRIRIPFGLSILVVARA